MMEQKEFFLKYTFMVNLVLAVLLFSHTALGKICEFNIANDICANIHFKNGISRKIDSVFEIYFEKKTDKGMIKKFELQKLPNLKLWMVMKSGHGHGSEPLSISILKEDHLDRYLVTNVWFMMLGQWDLEVELLVEGSVVKGKIPICVQRDIKKSKAGLCE